jgi:hypothetical protein
VDTFQLSSYGHFTESVTNQPPQTVSAAMYFSVPLLRPRINLGSNAFMGDTFTYPSGPGGSGSISWPTTLPLMAPTTETVR